MNIVSLLIALVSGAVGGNAAGAAMPDKSLGPLGNSFAGILGGGVGAAVLQALGIMASGGANMDVGSIVGNIASGGVGGGIAMAVIAAVKGAMSQKA
jgi:uncharacterized membrane protein YeaQ/YmgE (transglycosylase-associated protein family)